MIPVTRNLNGARGIAGPLLYLGGASRVAIGEWVEISEPGQPDRRGQVIEATADAAVVQVLEETLGLAPLRARVTLTGEVPHTIVGEELLGRVLTGMGRPLDGLPVPIGDAVRPVTGAPMNPARRLPPSEFIETGISAIDGMNTLVRGQKLPVFSGPGLPALELAARIVEWARAPRGEAFAVIFVGLGITERETREFLSRFEGTATLERSIFYLNRTGDPTVERLLAPRVALTQAEHLAFDAGYHVLVVIADVLHYCEALREIAAAREEIPARQGYPGYMYTDLAGIFERAGMIAGRPGSITQLPIVTMPDDDITHPIPDLTGYITEGQIVLNREMHRRGIFPPVDVLPSLSRLMNAAIGRDRTAPEHREWANQLYAIYARGREARLTAAIVGETGLDDSDRRALRFADRFEQEFVGQGSRRRALTETLAAGWALLEGFPRDELGRISDATLEAHRT
jgi:V/A-type H+-transporting ATPase subunit B